MKQIKSVMKIYDEILAYAYYEPLYKDKYCTIFSLPCNVRPRLIYSKYRNNLYAYIAHIRSFPAKT